MPALEGGLRAWFERYNTWRPHQGLGNRTPHQAHEEDGKKAVAKPTLTQHKEAA